MKTKIIISSVLCILIIAACKRMQEASEQPVHTGAKNQSLEKLWFYVGNSAHNYNAAASKIEQSSSAPKISSDQIISASYIDKIAHYPEQVSPGLAISESYDFFQGLQNPYDSDIWIYMERQRIGAGYHVYYYNTRTNNKTLLISESNSQRERVAFKPIGWTAEQSKVYLEALYLDDAREHEGIWVYDLDKKSNTRMDLSFKYMRTPILTPGREKFLIISTNDNRYNPLHGSSDVLLELDIKSKIQKTLINAKGQQILIQGWERKGAQIHAIPSKLKVSAVNYYLPWDYGTNYCVSRHGTPAPSGAHYYVSTCGIYSGGQHSYPAVDFATSTTLDQNVRAAAAGQVTFAGISGSLTTGYGRLVIITHSDGTRTYYGHNKTLFVTTGQNIPQGHLIAHEGTTGDSSGDHIHFEWRAAGGSASTMGTFTDRGQPRQDYRYQSNNMVGPPPAGVFETFTSNVGRFNTAPTYSGSTVGIATTSTNTWDSGTASLRVTLNDNTAVTTPWTVRLLSGTGVPANNVLSAKTGTLYFSLRTSTAQPGATVRIWVDDSDGTEVSPPITIINDGVMHTYSWNLSSYGGTGLNGGNGVIDAANVTLDAIVLQQPNTATQWVSFIDNVGN